MLIFGSYANFVFAKHNILSGEKIYRSLKQNGILVRHFDGERIKDYNRITIGSDEQMEVFIEKIKEIVKGSL